MAHVLVMPRQGNSVESCVLVTWRAAEGAKVAADEIVCEVETDKATFEVPAGAAGVLLKRLRAEGDDVPVLEPIGVIGEAGESWEAALAQTGAAVPAAPAAAPSASAADAALASKAEAGPTAAPAPAAAPPAELAASPRARRTAEAEGVPLAQLAGAGTGPHGRVIERDVLAAAAARPALTVAARAAALEGAPVPAAGTAIGGRAGVADLSGRASAAAPAVARAPQPVPAAAAEDGYTDAPLRNIRKIIAERMRASLASTAQLTFHATAPAARLTALRARFKGSPPELGLAGVTVGDLVLFVVSRVVPRFPDVNSHLLGTTLRTFQRVHLGLAVDTPRGLMVPVIRNADLLSLPELSAESKRLAAACQAGSIDPADLSGATFTVSNLGAFGVELFTPVLNAPQTGILGVDAITQGVAAGPDGAPVIEPRIGLSLTVDHQVIDGAPAARILKAFADGIAMVDLLVASGRVPGGAR